MSKPGFSIFRAHAARISSYGIAVLAFAIIASVTLGVFGS